MRAFMDLLGYPVRDTVTGFAGVVESISFDLYGCVQCVVKPKVAKDGKLEDGRWFDFKRLTKTARTRVMPMPSAFATPGLEAGPADKPRTSNRA